ARKRAWFSRVGLSRDELGASESCSGPKFGRDGNSCRRERKMEASEPSSLPRLWESRRERRGMTTELLIRILGTIPLIGMMAAIGIGVRPEDLSRIGRSPELLMRAAIANYIGVPLVTVVLLVWFGPAPMISAGFLILAVCPGAAYGPPFTAMAKGNVAAAV